MTYITNLDPFLEIVKGKVSGHSSVHKFGRNTAVGTSIEHIHSHSEDLAWLQSPSTLEAISSSPNDTAAGSGARSVTIVGIDSTLAEVQETIATNGTSASSSTGKSFWRPYRVYIPDGGVGTYGGSNEGTITIRVSSGGATVNEIDFDGVGMGQSTSTHYSVPTGKTAYLVSINAFVNPAQAANLYFFQRRNFNDVSTPFSPVRLVWSADGVIEKVEITRFSSPPSFPALTDIWMSAKATAGSADVSADYELILVDD